METTTNNTQSLQQYVGKFVAYTRKGVRCLGMIDEVFPDRLGFVTTHEDGSWSGTLVRPEDCTMLEGDEAQDAYRNAVTYFNLEADSLRCRIANKYKMDDNPDAQARMRRALGHCLIWQARLQANKQ